MDTQLFSKSSSSPNSDILFLEAKHSQAAFQVVMSSMLPVCSTTQSHLVRSLSDKIHPEINDFLLLGLGNRRTSLLLLSSFNFVILNDSLQLHSPSTKFFDLRKLANLFDLSRSYYQIFFSYFLSGSLIRINPC